MISFYMFLFFNIRGSILVFVVMCSINLVIVFYSNGFFKLDVNDFLVVIYFFLLACFIGQFTYIQSCEFKSHNIVQNRFKKIMDQSEEGIIIMNDQTIEYINDTFIR